MREEGGREAGRMEGEIEERKEEGRKGGWREGERERNGGRRGKRVKTQVRGQQKEHYYIVVHVDPLMEAAVAPRSLNYLLLRSNTGTQHKLNGQNLRA